MNDEMTLDLRDFFYILRKRIKSILVITIICTSIAGALSFFAIKPTYEAKTSIVIGKEQGATVEQSQYNYNDVMMFQKLVKTYAEIGQSRTVAEKASEKVKGLTAEQVQGMVTITPQADTQVIELKVRSNNAEQAYVVTNAVTQAFVQEAKRIYPSGSIEVIDTVKVPEKPIKPNKAVNIAIGFFIGLMASVGLAFVLEYMDNTIKTEDEINKYLNLPVIGIIPKNMES